MSNVCLVFLAWLALCAGDAAAASKSQPRLHIGFPADWEYREPWTRESVLYFHARQQRAGATPQALRLSVIDASAAAGQVDSASLLDLVRRLRGAALPASRQERIDVVPLLASNGYYFVATGLNGDVARAYGHKQLVEGAMLVSGYLITFTLLTDDAASADTTQMISALARLRVD